MLLRIPAYFYQMNIGEAREKYSGKTVRHMATGLTYKIGAIEEFKSKIEAWFIHLSLPDIPSGEPLLANLRELETHYRILD